MVVDSIMVVSNKCGWCVDMSRDFFFLDNWLSDLLAIAYYN